jgi:hypothetical protein
VSINVSAQYAGWASGSRLASPVMTGLARFFLMLTSLAPIGLVYAAVLAGDRKWSAAGLIFAASASLVIVCFLLLWGAKKTSRPVPLAVTNLASKEGDSLAFIVSYALPLVAAQSAGSPAGLAAFTVVMGLALWQQQVFHVNPLLAMARFHFFSATNDAEATILLLTRNKVVAKGDLKVVRLSEYLWLDCSDHGEARLGPASSDRLEAQRTRGETRE